MFEKTQFFNKLKFTRDDKTGYYLCSTKNQDGKRPRMHVYVWEYFNGKVPKGYHIHHTDGNKSNNTIENLQILSAPDHEALHAEFETDDQKYWRRIVFNREVRNKAKEWHGSDEGREWHKNHYKKMKDKLYQVRKYQCLSCGKEFEAANVNTKFCSNNCKSMYRRQSGIDNVETSCIVCGQKFVKNKYSKTQTCSRECGAKLCVYKRNNIHWES